MVVSKVSAPDLSGADTLYGERGEAVISEYRYSDEYVAPVQDSDVRAFLTNFGLPSISGIFVAREASGGTIGEDGGNALLQIGVVSETTDVGMYYVHHATGAVHYIDHDSASQVYVNASPRLFAECLLAFDSKTSVPAEMSDPEEASRLLEAIISDLDPSALADDERYWRSLLDDVAVGDYTDDD